MNCQDVSQLVSDTLSATSFHTTGLLTKTRKLVCECVLTLIANVTWNKTLQ